MRANLQHERWISRLLFASAAGGALVTLGLVVVLARGTVAFFGDVPLGAFLTDTVWSPTFAVPRFGILPLISGTLLVTAIAAALAIPPAVATAVFLDRIAGPRLQSALRSTLAALAGLPTVAYGYFALTFVSPRLRALVPGTPVFTAATAGIVVAIMILPMLVLLVEQALGEVPGDLSDAALALGATRTEATLRVLLPAAAPGVLAAVGLSLSRAVGETMIVTLAAGAASNLSLDAFEPVLTMTAFLVQVSLGDTPPGTVAHYSLYAVAATLFLITVTLNLASRRLRARSPGSA